MITNTGENLSILIVCDYIPCHHWMSCLSWYSMYKYLPEAKVAVACNRQLMKYQLFDWTKRCNVPFHLTKSTDRFSHAKYFLESNILSFPLLVIEPDIVALREIQNVEMYDRHIANRKALLLNQMSEPSDSMHNLYVDAKGNDFGTFVSYENGWGKFVTSSWINKEIHPITPLWKQEDADMTVNENRMNSLWKDFTPLFLAVRG